jgi:hypothetical protein
MNTFVMKNKLFVFSSGLLLLLAGCTKKSDYLFDKSPDERLNETLTANQKVLTSAPNGWKVYVMPKGLEKSDQLEVGGFSYFMTFTDNNRVTMYSDFDTVKAITPNESAYRLKATQRPSLFFDTYNYIHFPTDPVASISKSPLGYDGVGWGSDLEFSFADEKVQGDTIHLKGNQNGSIAIMVKATKAEADAYAAGGLKTSMKKFNDLNSLGYFKKLTFGNSSYYLGINESNRTITFNWLVGSNVQSFTTGYFHTLGGIWFTNPFVNGSLVVPGINFNSFNASTSTMDVTINGSAGTIVNGGAPLQVDVDAPKRWWQYSVDRDSWWSAYSGVTVNGEVDYFKMRSMPNFYALVFWGKYNAAYDAWFMFTLSNNTLNIGGGIATASQPTFTADGRVIFTYFGAFNPNPPTGWTAAKATEFRTLISDPNGYYLIQTGPLKYDMVKKDGKAWITWEW